ncbi:MAG: toxin-antitoxin system [Microbacteriaceae bacterium]|nr:toxin-antitoxin system [Microbacteriaceae bacterium]
MAQILVRNIPDAVKLRLQAQAKRNGRSMEAEAREILESAVGEPSLATVFYDLTRDIGGADEIFENIERRDMPRVVDFS